MRTRHVTPLRTADCVYERRTNPHDERRRRKPEFHDEPKTRAVFPSSCRMFNFEQLSGRDLPIKRWLQFSLWLQVSNLIYRHQTTDGDAVRATQCTFFVSPRRRATAGDNFHDYISEIPQRRAGRVENQKSFVSRAVQTKSGPAAQRCRNFAALLRSLHLRSCVRGTLFMRVGTQRIWS